METLPMIVAWAELADVGIWGLAGVVTIVMAARFNSKKEGAGDMLEGVVSALILIGFGFLCWAALAELPEAIKALAWAHSVGAIPSS